MPSLVSLTLHEQQSHEHDCSQISMLLQSHWLLYRLLCANERCTSVEQLINFMRATSGPFPNILSMASLSGNPVSQSAGLLKVLNATTAWPFMQQQDTSNTYELKCCVYRSKYIGEGSVACGMGLLTGLIVVILQRYLSAESVHQLLTFNPADFFT